MRGRSESTLWKVLFMVLLLCTTMGGIIINVIYGVTQPVIYVDPPTSTVALGKSFAINMSIINVTYPDAGKGVYGWECDISFNASILQTISVEEGPFLSKYYNTSWASPLIDNTAGTIVAGCQIKPPWPVWGVFGSGVLANVTFQTIAEGETHLNFTKTKLNTYTGTGLAPLDHTATNGSATITPGHDVGVVSVTAPAEAASGYSAPINVTVKNEGSYTENVNVTLHYDSTYIDSQNVTLAKKESQTVSFSWNTTGISKGNYALNSTATIDVDNDPTDNSKDITIRIVEHDVAVTDIDAPYQAKPGWIVSINVAVENQGNFTENLNVTVSYDGNLIGFNDTVALDPQSSTIVLFIWNTVGLPLGDYNLTATATSQTVPVDDDPTDNSKNKTITLYMIHDVAVISLEAKLEDDPYSPVGDLIPINVTVKNEGDYFEDVNVTLHYDSTYIDSQSITLAQGENQTVYFTWNTAGLTPSTYTVKATASLNYTDTWTGDNAAKSFYTTRKPVDLGSEKVYVNQTPMTKPADYTIDYETGNITFTTAPEEGAEVKAIYFSRYDDHSGNNFQTKTIILTIHDVAVININARSVIYPDFNVTINVTVKDEGSWRETINLTLKYDETLIGYKTFDVYKGLSTTVSFTWNTTGVPYGNYNLTATATILPNPNNPTGIDDDPVDNNLKFSFVVTMTGDVDGDFDIDPDDFYFFAGAYGTSPPSNPFCDLDDDGDIDPDDFYIFSGKYGWSYP